MLAGEVGLLGLEGVNSGRVHDRPQQAGATSDENRVGRLVCASASTEGGTDTVAFATRMEVASVLLVRPTVASSYGVLVYRSRSCLEGAPFASIPSLKRITTGSPTDGSPQPTAWRSSRR